MTLEEIRAIDSLKTWKELEEARGEIARMAAANQLLADPDPQYWPHAMVERAVRNARPHRTTKAPRWVAVKDVFGYGSTTSVELCRRFGLDPHERVQGAKCHCEEDRE